MQDLCKLAGLDVRLFPVDGLHQGIESCLTALDVDFENKNASCRIVFSVSFAQSFLVEMFACLHPNQAFCSSGEDCIHRV